MIEKQYIQEQLTKTFCYKCGTSLGGASVVPVSEMPIALIAHVTCLSCKAESVITVTMAGVGIMPIVSDLMGGELRKFVGAKNVSYDELLDLHQILKRKNLWNLLHTQEKSLEKKQKYLEDSINYQL